MFSALHTTWVALMFVAAIFGLAALQRPYFGRLGRIATVVALVGTGGLAILPDRRRLVLWVAYPVDG